MTALTFPLALDTFFGPLLIAEVMFDAAPQVEMNQTGGGEQMTAELAPQLWKGSVKLAVMTRAEASSPDVLLDVLRRPDATFYAHDTRRPAPLADPAGAVLGATVPTIASLPAGNREISLTGLPASYVLSRGDWLAWDYDSGRRALHRVVAVTATASAGGVTPAFEIAPPIRPGVSVGTAVTLIRAACKVKIATGSVVKGMSRRIITDGMAFDFIQTLRGSA